jgi:hypothetical protein
LAFPVALELPGGKALTLDGSIAAGMLLNTLTVLRETFDG